MWLISYKVYNVESYKVGFKMHLLYELYKLEELSTCGSLFHLTQQQNAEWETLAKMLI